MSEALSTPETRGSLVNRDVAARLIMVSAKRIDQLVKEGWIRRVGRNQYDVVDVVQGYIRFHQDGLERMKEMRADNVVTEARAREIDQRVAMRAEQLIELAEHDEIVDVIVRMIRKGVRPFPSSLPSDLAPKASALIDGVFERIERRISEHKKRLHSAPTKRR